MVYIDSANISYRRMKMCHMVADTLEELHSMADQIGVSRRYFQDKTKYHHYDICLTKKRQALKLGAIEISSRELILKMRQNR